MRKFLSGLWSSCLKSLTIAWSYVLAAVGAAMNWLDQIAAMINDSSFAQQVSNLLGTDPKTIGKWLMVVAAVNIVTRVRSMVFKPKAD